MNGKTCRSFPLICLFLLALSLRLLYLASIPKEAILESVDARGYDLLARNLQNGYGFSLQDQAPYQPDGLRTPLYPIFVAGVYSLTGFAPTLGPTAVAVVQALLDSLTALLVGKIAGMVLGQRSGCAAAFLYALTPVQWRYAAALVAEIPLAFLISLTVWLLLCFTNATKPSGVMASSKGGYIRYALTCGAAAGLAALCKPNAVGLGLIVMVAVILALQSDLRHALIAATTVGLGVAAMISPWVVRNWSVFGRPFLSTAALGYVARVAAPATLGIVEDHQVSPWSNEWEARYHAIVTQAATQHRWGLETATSLEPEQADQREQQIARVAAQILLAHPWDALRAHVAGFVRSWAPQEQTFWYTHVTHHSWADTGVARTTVRDAVDIMFDGRAIEAFEWAFIKPWEQLNPVARAFWYGWGLGHVAGVGLMAFGVWRLRHRRIVALTLATTILIMTGPPGPIGYVRFRVPAVPLITALEVAGMVWLVSKLRLLPADRPGNPVPVGTFAGPAPTPPSVCLIRSIKVESHHISALNGQSPMPSE